MLKRLRSGCQDVARRGLPDGIAMLRKLLPSGAAPTGHSGRRGRLIPAGWKPPGWLVSRLKTAVQGAGRTLLGRVRAQSTAAAHPPGGVPPDDRRTERSAKKETPFIPHSVEKLPAFAPINHGDCLKSGRSVLEQMIRGRRGCTAIFDDISEIYKGVKKGRILLKEQLPAADDPARDLLGPAVAAARQEAAGDGETVRGRSWLAIAGRILAAPAGSVGDLQPASLAEKAAAEPAGGTGPEATAAAWAAFRRSPAPASHSASAEGDGLRALHEALSAARPGGESAQDCIAKAARTGASLAQAALRKSGRPGAAVSGIAPCLAAIPGGGSLAVSAGANRAVNLPPLPGRTHRNVLAERSGAYLFREAAAAPEGLARAISPAALEHARAVAAKHGVILDLLPPSRCARELIETGAAIPVPAFIHNRALAGLESLLGAAGKPGSIGHYLPALPSENTVPAETYAEIRTIAAWRIQEYCEEFLNVRRLESSGIVFVRDGVIHDAQSGKAFAGGAELFEIRDASTGEPIPLYVANPDGSPAYDRKTGFPLFHPLREAVIRELRAGPFRARGGAVGDGMRRWSEPASDEPGPGGVRDLRCVPEDGLLLAVWPDGRLQAICLVRAGGAGQ